VRLQSCRLLVVVCAAAYSTGCTVWGTGIGYLVSAGYDHSPVEQPADARAQSRRFAVKHGDSVRLELRDGSVVKGTYRGVRGPSAEDPGQELPE